MKHEAEILPVQEVPTQIVTDVVFTPDAELNAAIDTAFEHQKRSEAAKRGWETRRRYYGPSGWDSCCTASRSGLLYGYR